MMVHLRKEPTSKDAPRTCEQLLLNVDERPKHSNHTPASYQLRKIGSRQHKARVSGCTVTGLFLLLIAVLNNATHVGLYRHKIQRRNREPAVIATTNSDGKEVLTVVKLNPKNHQRRHLKERKHHYLYKEKVEEKDDNQHHRDHEKPDDNRGRPDKANQQHSMLPTVLDPESRDAMPLPESTEKVVTHQDSPTNIVKPSREADLELDVPDNNTYSSEGGEPEVLSTELLQERCSPWNMSLDGWWLLHPDWELGSENETHACLRRIADPERASFFREVHALQFNNDTSNCDKASIRQVADVGFAGHMLFHLNAGFWSAFRQKRRFQTGLPSETFRWMYVPENISSWASCPTQDHECYFLPISNCPRPVGGTRDDKPKKRFIYQELSRNQTLAERNMWLSHFLMRPRQALRHRLYQFLQSDDVPKVQAPCTWIHVRRADAMTEVNYVRGYYRLQEYLSRGGVFPKDNVLLLTDDRTTIEEALALHPDYHWHYWNRTRVRGPVEYNTHIPSGDPALEVLYILAERKLSSQCQKGVYGKSNMATLFRNAMALEHGGLANVSMVQIGGGLHKTRVEPEDFVKTLDSQLDSQRTALSVGTHLEKPQLA